MSIGMQESGCNPAAEGARGEQGIMQVAGNACDNSAGDCKEPWYNIHKGAEILVEKMGKNPDGNIIEALGKYNGWMVSLPRGLWRVRRTGGLVSSCAYYSSSR
jgi:membrane-bound lytic murein transglycosylase MltF